MPPRELTNAYVRWRFSTDAAISATPAIADVNSDGHQEVIASSQDGFLFALSEKGRPLWEFEANNRFTASPAIVELPGLGPTILAPNWDHCLYALGGDGEPRWIYDAGARLSNAPPAVADIDGDGKPEIVFSCGFDGTLRVIRADGTPIWSTTLNRYLPEGASVDLSPTLASFDKLNITHILAVGSDGCLYSVAPDGEQMWHLRPDGGLGPVCAVSESYGIIVAGSEDGRVFGISPQGDVLWVEETNAPALFPVISRSLDGRMLIATESAVVVNPGGETNIIWHITHDVERDTLERPTLAEWSSKPRSVWYQMRESGPAIIRRKKGLRVIVGVGTRLRVHEEAGAKVVDIEVGEQPTSPVVGDLDRDGRLTAIVGTQAGEVVAVRLPRKVRGRDWLTYRDGTKRHGWRQ